jgi:hypothetical protein
MTTVTLPELVSQLLATQAVLTTLLQAVADQQDWRPGAESWSFRYLAAHLATAEKEAFQKRVRRIAGEEAPYFAYYLNTGRDFSQNELLDSLQQWADTRREIIDFVLALPPEGLKRTGSHQTRGVITILDVLQMMLEHDQEHLQELSELVSQFKQGDRN